MLTKVSLRRRLGIPHRFFMRFHLLAVSILLYLVVLDLHVPSTLFESTHIDPPRYIYITILNPSPSKTLSYCPKNTLWSQITYSSITARSHDHGRVHDNSQETAHYRWHLSLRLSASWSRTRISKRVAGLRSVFSRNRTMKKYITIILNVALS